MTARRSGPRTVSIVTEHTADVVTAVALGPRKRALARTLRLGLRGKAILDPRELMAFEELAADVACERWPR